MSRSRSKSYVKKVQAWQLLWHDNTPEQSVILTSGSEVIIVACAGVTVRAWFPQFSFYRHRHHASMTQLSPAKLPKVILKVWYLANKWRHTAKWDHHWRSNPFRFPVRISPQTSVHSVCLRRERLGEFCNAQSTVSAFAGPV